MDTEAIKGWLKNKWVLFVAGLAVLASVVTNLDTIKEKGGDLFSGRSNSSSGTTSSDISVRDVRALRPYRDGDETMLAVLAVVEKPVGKKITCRAEGELLMDGTQVTSILTNDSFSAQTWEFPAASSSETNKFSFVISGLNYSKTAEFRFVCHRSSPWITFAMPDMPKFD